MLWWLTRLAIAAAFVAAGLWWVRRGLTRARTARAELAAAIDAFGSNRADLAELFRRAAEATGKPRGLAWKRCDLADDAPLVARDRATGELVALTGVTIAFEAVPGGDMEQVEAVGNLRDATAVFAWRGGRWTTDGRAVFNLGPSETLERYSASLDAVELPQ